MTSIIGKTFRLNTFAPGSDMKQRDEQEIIRNLDYDELEKKFQIYKYYPSFIHNNDCSTPRLKAMICSKPIYAKASGPTNKPDKAKKSEAKKAEREERHRLRHERVQEKREMKQEHRKERHMLREQHREERKTSRIAPPQNINETYVEHIEYAPESETDFSIRPDSKSEVKSKPEPVPAFNNPFGSGQATLVANDSASGDANSKEPMGAVRRTSISDRLRGIFLKRPTTEHPAKRSMSFDQTKTNLTSSRAAELSMMKLTENRRPSDDIRTYTFFLNNSLWLDYDIGKFPSDEIPAKTPRTSWVKGVNKLH